MLSPSDITTTLVALGAEFAFTWTGAEPRNREEFFIELGRRLARLTDSAWQKELAR